MSDKIDVVEIREVISDLNCPDHLYPPVMLIDSGVQRFETYDLDWLPEEFRNPFTDSFFVTEDLDNSQAKRDLESIISVTNYYSENFPSSPKSQPSKTPTSILQRGPVFYEKTPLEQKGLEFFKKQYLRYKRNKKIKQSLNKFYYDILFRKFDFTNGTQKDKVNFFVKILWILDAKLLKFIREKNLFITDSKDMIYAIQLGIEGKFHS